MINKTIRKIEKGSMVFMTTPIKYVKAESKKKKACGGTIWVAELFSLTLLGSFPDSTRLW